MTFVFIYARGGIIKVLNMDDAKEQGYKLQAEGWVHTSTLDACVYLEYLHNERGYFDRGTDIDLLSHAELK